MLYAESLTHCCFEWSKEHIDDANPAGAPVELAVALSAAARRAGHFCNGILESEFTPNSFDSRSLYG